MDCRSALRRRRQRARAILESPVSVVVQQPHALAHDDEIEPPVVVVIDEACIGGAAYPTERGAGPRITTKRAVAVVQPQAWLTAAERENVDEAVVVVVVGDDGRCPGDRQAGLAGDVAEPPPAV